MRCSPTRSTPTFVGPNPAINAFQKSNGEAIRIVAGSTSGGAGLVVKPSITKPSDLKGKKIATPQLGNTQDVALRAYLKSQGLNTDTSGGGDVSIIPQANADTLTQFAAGRHRRRVGARAVLHPPPAGERRQGARRREDAVAERPVRHHAAHRGDEVPQRSPRRRARLIKGEADAIKFINDSPADAQKVTNDGIAKISGKPLKDAVVAAAFKNLTFTLDPIASSLKKSAQDAYDVGLLKSTNLDGIYDLSLLNKVLKDSGKPQVQGL